MLFDVTYTTVVPQLVREDQITAANARLYGSYAAAFLVGPALAGLVSGRFGPSVAVGVDALSFLLSAIGVSFVRLRDPTSGPETSPTHDGFLAGVRYLWGQPVLRALTVLLTLMTPIIVGLNDVVVYRLKHDLRQPDAIVGMVLSAGIVGTLLASASVTALRRRWGFGPTWIATSALCGVTIAGIGLVAGVPEIAALSAAGTLCTGIGGICSMSLRQEITPGPLLGRVTAAFWTIHSALGPLGAAGLTLAASRAGVPGTLVVAGAACTVIALAALVTPVRRR
jgi:Na+/melibiose symporter-like transporter